MDDANCIIKTNTDFCQSWARNQLEADRSGYSAIFKWIQIRFGFKNLFANRIQSGAYDYFKEQKF